LTSITDLGGSVTDWGSDGPLVDSWLGNSLSVDGLSNGLSVDGLGNGNWSVSNGLNDGWGGTVNDGVESVDGVSGVGNGTNGTIGLDKGVLSLDNITVTGLMGGLLVSGEGIRDGVSVVVLWVGVKGLGADGGLSIGYWGGDSSTKKGLLGVGKWGSLSENWTGSVLWSESVLSGGYGSQSEDDEKLHVGN
jgi:hypothetical protein